MKKRSKHSATTCVELAKLRPLCASQDDEGRWIYQAGQLDSDEIKSREELTTLVDKRSLEELSQQARDALEQMLVRAHLGDAGAIRKLATLIRGAVGSLEDLTAAQNAKVKSEAETLPDWPVLVSQNPADAKRAKESVETLAVGMKSSVQTRAGSRVNRQTFWTSLAERAFATCKINKNSVPELIACCENAKRKRESISFWDTEVPATFYYLSAGDVVIIPDWARDCVELDLPVNRANVRQWWHVVKLAVLQHWQTNPAEYEQALKKIGVGESEEYSKRSRAVDAIKQAFESLVGVPVKEVP